MCIHSVGLLGAERPNRLGERIPDSSTVRFGIIHLSDIAPVERT